jgi:elongation factor 4
VVLLQAVQGRVRETSRLTSHATVCDYEQGKLTTVGGVSSAAQGNIGDPRNGFSVQEVGVLTPEALRTGGLQVGQVGYVIAGLKSTRQARIGDTMYIPAEWKHAEGSKPPALPGYEAAKCMLFASVYPIDSGDLDNLFAAMDRLVLNDSSISVQRESSSSLGAGLRCGFLGFLHIEVTIQRLRDEFGLEVVMTTPSVPYKITLQDGTNLEIDSVAQWPDHGKSVKMTVHEPVVAVTLMTPQQYLGDMLEVVKHRRGSEIETIYLQEADLVRINALVPWQEVVCDMSDAVKGRSAGYATFNYTDAGYVKGNLQKVDLLVNGKLCDPLSFVHHVDSAAFQGRELCKRLKGVLKRQQFEVVIQAFIGGKSVARERIAPYRKDVLIKSGKLVGGGDESRKKKLLEKQKEGKKKAKMVGNVEIDQKAFWAVLQR